MASDRFKHLLELVRPKFEKKIQDYGEVFNQDWQIALGFIKTTDPPTHRPLFPPTNRPPSSTDVKTQD